MTATVIQSWELTVLNLTVEQKKIRAVVIKYVKEAYRLSVNTRVPSLRGEICKHVKDELGIPCYPDKLQGCFPPELDGPGPLMKRICKASAVRYPRERGRLAKKAINGKKKRAKKKGGKKKLAKRDVEPAVTEVQETARQPGSLEDIQQSIEIQNEQERYREKTAKEEVERLKILFRDPNPKISGPVKDALGELMPEILSAMFGIKVTVPELIAMQKTYDEATKEGWHVEDVMEWAALSKEEQETFKEQRQKALDEGLSVGEYISTCKGEVEDLKAKKAQLSKDSERLSRTVERLKREEESLNQRCSRLNRWLEEDYQQKKKSLEEKYLRDIDGCKVEFLKFKEKLQAMKKELIDDYKDLETKRGRLVTECENIEKQFANRVKAANETLDKKKTETTEARNELKQLRALVGPKGTVADLATQKEELKAQLKEKDQQLAEKTMEVAGKWLNQEDALQIFNEENKRLMGELEGACRLVSDELERRIESAGPALYFLEFLESELPDEKFKGIVYAIDMAQVKRESQNPDNPYFANLPAKKKRLLGVFPTKEEYQRIHTEKMERLHKYREANLQRIREVAYDIGMKEIWVNRGIHIMDNWVKPIVEAYFNPKEPRLTTPDKERQKRTGQE